MNKIASKRYDLLLSMAGAKPQNRKALEKELNKARAEFVSYQNAYKKSLNDYNEAERMLESAREGMNEARKKILDITKFIQTMDLTGAEGVNQRGDSVNYIMDGKEYHIDTTNVNNPQYIPWKEYKKMQGK